MPCSGFWLGSNDGCGLTQVLDLNSDEIEQYVKVNGSTM